jgi:hypothetical protein
MFAKPSVQIITCDPIYPLEAIMTDIRAAGPSAVLPITDILSIFSLRAPLVY